MARRYGKEIAVVEPVKGGALMNLPEEAAVLLYQADATAGPASSWSHPAHCGAGRGFDCFKRHEKSGAIGEQHGLHCQPGGVLCGSAPDLQKGIRLHPLWPAGENCPQRLPPVICWKRLQKR